MKFNISQWNSKVGSVLGWEVFCTVRDQRVNRDAYKETFATMFGYEPEVDSDALAFCEAVHDVSKINFLKEEKVSEENGKHSFRIVKKKIIKENKDVKYRSGLLVEWDDKNKSLTFDDTENKLCQSIKDTFDTYRATVSDHKFRQNYKNAVLKNAGISLRDTGGIYFIPNIPGNKDIVENLQKLFKNFDNGKLYPIAFEDKDGSCVREVVAEAVKGDLRAILEQAREEWKEINKKRSCGIRTIIENIGEGINKGDGFGVLLEMEGDIDDLTGELREIQNMYVDALKKSESR